MEFVPNENKAMNGLAARDGLPDLHLRRLLAKR